VTGSHFRLVPEQPPADIPPRIAKLIATQGLELVKNLASKYARANDVGLDKDELLSLGQSVLNEVGPRYDAGYRARFTTYIFPFVDGAMQDLIRRRRHERKVHGAIAHAIQRERRQFAATQSDEFDVLHNTPERTCAQLDDTMSDLAARLAGTAVVTASQLLHRDTPEGLHEARRHEVAVQTFHEAIPLMEPKLQKLWELHYEQGLELKDYAKAVGVSIASAKLYHKKFKDRLREILKEKGYG
jgi:RNA polymerase sigma factor (sigma-70 family)